MAKAGTVPPGPQVDALVGRPNIQIERPAPMDAHEAVQIACGIYARYYRRPNQAAVAELMVQRN